MNVKPFSEDAIAVLRSAAYSAKEKGVYLCSEAFPPNLVYMSTISKVIVWRVPRSVHKINSTMEDFPAGKMSFPDMIFMIKEQTLYAWAVNDQDLYMLCLPNYDNETGYVCVEIKEDLLEAKQVMENAQASFFRSIFNGWSHNKESEAYKKLVTSFYQDQTPWLKGKQGKTIQKLHPFSMDLQELISSII